MGQEEIKLVEEYNGALKDAFGNLDAIREMLPKYITETTTLLEAPTLPWGGRWVGVDGYMTVFERVHESLRSHSDSQLRQVPDGARDVELEAEYFSDGATVFMRMTRPVRSLELYDVRDGKITNIEVYMHDNAAMIAAMET